MERLLKTPFCSALDTSVSVIQYALLEFSYGCVSIRTPWLPPFVLCVSQNLTSAALTNRSEDGDSQAERAVALRREIFSPSHEIEVSLYGVGSQGLGGP